MQTFCPTCACIADHPAHVLQTALRQDDLDTAMTLGLLDAQPCPACTSACQAHLLAARDARRVALAARERHRARAARLARIQLARAAARRPASTATTQQAAPALPSAAADALARALAKAKARHA